MNTTPNPRATNNSNGVFDELELPCLSLSGVGTLVEEVVAEDMTAVYHAIALGGFFRWISDDMHSLESAKDFDFSCWYSAGVPVIAPEPGAPRSFST